MQILRYKHTVDLEDRNVILEVDECQHYNRNCHCEQTRMVNVSQSLGCHPFESRHPIEMNVMCEDVDT